MQMLLADWLTLYTAVSNSSSFCLVYCAAVVMVHMTGWSSSISTLGRILDAFRDFRVGTSTFAGVDGYGNGDVGRETLDKIYARLFGAEAALVRTHGALSCDRSYVCVRMRGVSRLGMNRV